MPHLLRSLLTGHVIFLNSPAAAAAAATFNSPDVQFTVESKRTEVCFLVGCAELGMCIYKYIIYINIYNTDLNQISLTYIFFNLCQKCVFKENLIFILRLCTVTHLYTCASFLHGSCSCNMEVSHSTCTEGLATPLHSSCDLDLSLTS